MENIIIHDCFLNIYELKTLTNIIKKKEYNYGHTSGDDEAFAVSFFSTKNNENFFNIYMLNKINEVSNKKFKINRHYMHIQTFGQDGSFHIDDYGSNTFTFCLYITNLQDEDVEKYGGDFLIKIPNDNKIISIETNNNRGIFFPSNYIHKGMAYNILCDKPRLCITWKLELI
jgi:hypothetical protein